MNHDTSNGQDLPPEKSPEPNEDGCVLGTAGRNEDPNATTDWDHPDDTSPERAPEPPTSGKNPGVTLPPNGTPGIDTVPGPQNDDGK